MLAAYFMKDQAHEEKQGGRLIEWYTRVVAWSVRYRYLTVVIGVVLFALSILSTKLLPSGFLPPQDAARSLLAIELPPGTQLSGTQTRDRKHHPEAEDASGGAERLCRRRPHSARRRRKHARQR